MSTRAQSWPLDGDEPGQRLGIVWHHLRNTPLMAPDVRLAPYLFVPVVRLEAEAALLIQQLSPLSIKIM